MIEQFLFLRPALLILLPAGLVLAWAVSVRGASQSGWEKACDPHLLAYQLETTTRRRSRLPGMLAALAWTLGCLAAAGPAWEKKPQPMAQDLDARVLVFDLSRSMNSTDILPNRLERARFKLTDLVRQGADLQQGLVVFAGDAFVVAPITSDMQTLINLIPSLDTRTVPVQGSRTDLAIDSAASLLAGAGFAEGEIILITDGVSGRTAEAASGAAAQGFRVSVLGVGTRQGGPVRLPNGELLKDLRGNIVVPNVDHDRLQRIAAAGSGRYSALTADNRDIELLGNPPAARGHLQEALFSASGGQEPEYRTDSWVDNGPWLLLPLVPLCALAFRRGWILLLCLALAPAMPEPAQAFDWTGLWLRPEQQAAKLFEQEQYDRISDKAPAGWHGSAQYRNGDFSASAETFARGDPDHPDTHYNTGNALARHGSLEQAAEAYAKALELDARHLDAQHNLDLVTSLLRQQQASSAQSRNDDEEDQAAPRPPRNEGRPDQAAPSEEEQESHPQARRGDDRDQSRMDQETASSRLEDRAEDHLETAEQSEQSTGHTDGQAESLDERQQALEAWLNRIPDDPGGLLRRKFAYQSSRREPIDNPQEW